MKYVNGCGTIKFEDLVCMDRPEDVREEVYRIALLMFPELDVGPIRQVFSDIVDLFKGYYPGYKQCNIYYHDLKHTTDCLMAMARLIHGAVLEGIRLDERHVILGLIASLLHDTGYLQRQDDKLGTGAKYTLSHVERSIEFMDEYFQTKGFSREDFVLCRACLLCTGLQTKVSEITFESHAHEILGKILGTADLLGQMADRTYLERLPFLYLEFSEGGVPGFENELDLLKKTPGFWEFTKQRFAEELSNVDRFMQRHFLVRWGLDRDLYREAIEKNMLYVSYLVEKHPADYRKHLRRGGLMEVLEAMAQGSGGTQRDP